MQRRVLVTGGAGFIGSAVVRALIRQTPHTVLVVDKLTYAGNLDNLEPVAAVPRCSLLKADITDEVVMRRAFHEFAPNIVIHLAAETHVDRSIEQPSAFLTTNCFGTFVLLQEAMAHFNTLRGSARDTFRFVHVSTDEVFGSLGPEGLFYEDSPYRPNSPYAASKASADHLVRAWHHTYGLPTLTTNCSNNYGPYQFPEKLIPLLVLNALRGLPLPIYGRGQNVRDWLHVDDHAEALILVAERGQPGATYNIGARNERRNLDIAKAICEIVDTLAPTLEKPREELITYVADRPGHDHRYALDATKIERELQWRASRSFETGLRDTVQWYLENSVWCERVLSGAYREAAGQSVMRLHEQAADVL